MEELIGAFSERRESEEILKLAAATAEYGDGRGGTGETAGDDESLRCSGCFEYHLDQTIMRGNEMPEGNRRQT